MGRNPLENVIYKFILIIQLSLVDLYRLCEMGDKWLYNRCLVECYFQDFFKTAHNIFV